MSPFAIFVHDDRYSVPTLHLVPEVDEREARGLAATLLGASPHHLGVELCRDGEQILAMGACAERRVSSL